MSSEEDKFPATPSTSGWYPLNDGSDQETFWDGTAWTKRRQYRFGSPFLERPLHRGDPPVTPLPPPPTPSTPTTGYLPPPPTGATPFNATPSADASIDRNWSRPTASHPSTLSP